MALKRGPTVDLKGTGPKLLPTDRVILVLGNTGTGKSTFIQALTGQHAGVGQSLFSATAVVSVYRYTHDGQTTILLDTPGMDDSEKSDAYVLTALGSWLAASYYHKVTIAGILYLHRINDPRMTGSAFRRLRIYLKLLGEEALARTILVTTHWPEEGDGYYRVACSRETELQNDPRLLEPLIRQGARMIRFTGAPDFTADTTKENEAQRAARKLAQKLAHESACKIIGALPSFDPRRGTPLQIQKELVDQNMGLQKTQAGRLVAESTQDMIGFYELTLKDLKEVVKRTQSANDAQTVERRTAAEKEISLYKGLLNNTKKDSKALSIKWKNLINGILVALHLIVREN